MCNLCTAQVTVSNVQLATNTAVVTANCSITNNVWIHSDNIKELVVGVPCLQETVAGVELQLPPVKNLWNTIHGAEMLCQALEELLAPSKKMTVLDVGCGIGLLGLYLSKVCIVCSICLFVCLFVLKHCRGKLRVVSSLPHFLLYNNYIFCPWSCETDLISRLRYMLHNSSRHVQVPGHFMTGLRYIC
jgi:hypothetical protein